MTVPSPEVASELRPHRGTGLLVLGILGIFCCGPCAPITWVLASGDLKKMAAGAMDGEGQKSTMAAKILGIFGTLLMIVVPLVALPVVLVLVGEKAAVLPFIYTVF